MKNHINCLDSGGLIVIGLFILGWDVNRCIQLFDILAKRVFQKSRWLSRTLYGRLKDIIRFMIGGIFGERVIENTLKDIFG